MAAYLDGAHVPGAPACGDGCATVGMLDDSLHARCLAGASSLVIGARDVASASRTRSALHTACLTCALWSGCISIHFVCLELQTKSSCARNSDGAGVNTRRDRTWHLATRTSEYSPFLIMRPASCRMFAGLVLSFNSLLSATKYHGCSHSGDHRGKSGPHSRLTHKQKKKNSP